MTLKGLVSLSGDGVDSVRSGIQELEKAGYLRRSRSRNNLGQLLCTEYTIYEHAVTENVASETEIDDNLNIIYSEESHVGKSNTIKDLNNKDTNNINNYPYQSTYSSKLCREPKENSIDEMEKAQTLYEERKAYEEIIKQNIAYDLLTEQKETSRDFFWIYVFK